MSTPVEKFNQDVKSIERFYREPTDAEKIEVLERRVAQLERQEQAFAKVYDSLVAEASNERAAKVLLVRVLKN